MCSFLNNCPDNFLSVYKNNNKIALLSEVSKKKYFLVFIIYPDYKKLYYICINNEMWTDLGLLATTEKNAKNDHFFLFCAFFGKIQ
jgi:hypothetical protein